MGSESVKIKIMKLQLDSTDTPTGEKRHKKPRAKPFVRSHRTPEKVKYKNSPLQRTSQTEEIGGPGGPEPTRYGDWEVNGRCSDF